MLVSSVLYVSALFKLLLRVSEASSKYVYAQTFEEEHLGLQQPSFSFSSPPSCLSQLEVMGTFLTLESGAGEPMVGLLKGDLHSRDLPPVS